MAQKRSNPKARSAKAKDLRGAAAVYRQAQRKTAKKTKSGQYTRQDAEKYKKLADHYKAQAERNPMSSDHVRSIVREELQRNPAPSLVGNVVGTFFPLDTMRTLGQGAANDAKRLIGNPRRRNHGETAADVFEGFHGTPATRTEVYEDRILIEDSLAECGPLQSIRVKTVTGFTTTIKFDKDRQPILCSSPDRNQLYIVGGDQELDLRGLGFEGESKIKHLMKIGVAKQVTYFAKKGFDNFEPTDYFHDLGEENGVKPDLMYDTLNKTLSLIGGDYRVLNEGITN